MNRLTDRHKRRWLVKQLLPLHYCTISRPTIDGVQKPAEFVRWRMWMGRCFNVQREPLSRPDSLRANQRTTE